MSNPAKEAAKTRAMRAIPLAPGWQRIINFDSAQAPCGCVTHHYASVPATGVHESDDGRRRCLACGAEWLP